MSTTIYFALPTVHQEIAESLPQSGMNLSKVEKKNKYGISNIYGDGKLYTFFSGAKKIFNENSSNWESLMNAIFVDYDASKESAIGIIAGGYNMSAQLWEMAPTGTKFVFYKKNTSIASTLVEISTQMHSISPEKHDLMFNSLDVLTPDSAKAYESSRNEEFRLIASAYSELPESSLIAWVVSAETSTITVIKP